MTAETERDFDLEATLKKLLEEYGRSWAKFNATDNLWEWMAQELPHTPWMRRQLARAWREGLIWRRPNKNQPAYIDENPYEERPGRIRHYHARTPSLPTMQWNGTAEHATRVVDWILDNGGTARYHGPEEEEEVCIKIDAPGRTLTAFPFDYIIKMPEGWFQPIGDKLFRERFEPG